MDCLEKRLFIQAGVRKRSYLTISALEHKVFIPSLDTEAERVYLMASMAFSKLWNVMVDIKKHLLFSCWKRLPFELPFSSMYD